MLTAAREYGLTTEMVIHVTDGDGTISDFLAGGKVINTAISAIVEEVTFYDGVNLNFEGLGLSQRGEALNAVRRIYLVCSTTLPSID